MPENASLEVRKSFRLAAIREPVRQFAEVMHLAEKQLSRSKILRSGEAYDAALKNDANKIRHLVRIFHST